LARKSQFALVPLVVGLLGVAACSSKPAAPASPAPPPAAAASVVTTQAVAAVQASASSTAAASATRAASATSGTAPTRAASASAVASAAFRQGSAGPIDACALVTRTEAEAASGLAMPRKNASTDASAPSCEYGEEDAFGVTVSIAVVPSGGKRSFDDTGASLGSGREDVSGVGDDAYIVTGLRMMYVLKGDTLLRIQLANPSLSGDVYRAHLKTMAQTAIGRL
jgi:hypothetical protein